MPIAAVIRLWKNSSCYSKDSKLYTWGYNDYGQLGWGLHGVDRVGQQRPNLVKGMLESEDVIDFACGGGCTDSQAECIGPSDSKRNE